LSAQARATLACGLLAFIGIQLGLPMIAGSDNTAVRDPLFEIKWTKLRERLQEHPERPLILVLGSSRPAAGIRPELWQEHSASDQSPMVFNFAMAGVGPRQQLIYLRRLLSAGIRPSGVLIEILPASLNQSGHASEDQMIKKRGLEAEELAILNGSLSPAPSPDSQPSSEWGSHWSSLRLRMLRRFAPAWVETDVSSNASPKQFSPWGWRPFAKGVQVASAEEYRRGIERSRAEFEYRLVNWEVTEIADRAVRQMLNDCRREHIRTALYLMPEATAFQKMYPPEVRTKLKDYLASLSQDGDISVLDATEWNADQDFYDGHHLLADGATRFTQRFGREFVGPFATSLSDVPRLSQRPLDQR
jgi:hypothetical protein